MFVPAGRMGSGLSNGDKSRVREQFAQGLVDRDRLLEVEQAAYHGIGTCTFYGNPQAATDNGHDMGRDLFGGMRRLVSSAEQGAVTWL